MPASRELYAAPLHPDLQDAVRRSLQAAATDPLDPVHLLAPNPAIVAHLAQECARSDRTAVQLRPWGWRSLALELAAPERRGSGRRLLSTPAAAWHARSYLASAGRPAGYFDAALGVRGFRAAMLRTFAELSAAGFVGAPQVERFILKHGPALRPRARHVLEMYLGLRRSFERGHDDRAAVLEQAADVPEGRLAELGIGRLWIYGFAELGILEKRLLERLGREPGLDLRLFLPLPDAAELVDELRNFGFAPATPEARPAAAVPVEVQVLSAAGEEAEAREVARRILAAAATGIPFGRVAVIARSERQLPLVADTLGDARIPHVSTAGQPLASTRAGRALLAFLDLLDAGLAPAPVMTFLAVAPLRWDAWCGIGADPVPSAWERAAHAACLGKGLDDWRVKLERLGAQHAERRRQRSEAGEPTLGDEAGERAAAELLTVALALDAAIGSIPVRARWAEFTRALADFVAAAFVADRTTGAVLAALERLPGLDALRQPRPTRADFRDLVRHVLADSRRFDSSAEGSGAVVLGTAADLYGIDFDLVCIVGVQEGEWPAPAAEDPVLPDLDRKGLCAALGDPHALPLRAALVERERRAFRAAAGAARRRLVIGYSRLDPATGAARLPSLLLLELAEEREGRRLDYAGFDQLPWIEPVPIFRTRPPEHGPVVSLAEYDTLAVARLPRAAARRYVRRLGGFAARGLVLDAERNGRARFTAFDGRLGGRVQPALGVAMAGRVYSASQLATWATCPFRFFMRHLLGVESLDHDEHRELSLLEMGRLVHRILEIFHRGLAQEGLTLDAGMEALKRRLQAAVREGCAEIEAKGRQGARVLWGVRQQRLHEDLVRFVRQEMRQSIDSGWVPEAFEQRFGPGRARGFAVSRSGADPLQLAGTIDRVDRHRRHDGVCVVDYKSGRRIGRRADARAVQLVLYLLAACAGDAARLDRSEGRFLYVTRRGGFGVHRLSGSRVRARRAEFEELVRSVAAGVEGGEFSPEPGPQAVHCRSCDYRSVCDARIERQVESKRRAGQDARWAGLPDFSPDLATLEGGGGEPDPTDAAGERGGGDANG
jgi:ATP-dependent helicase/nuclease subunit B